LKFKRHVEGDDQLTRRQHVLATAATTIIFATNTTTKAKDSKSLQITVFIAPFLGGVPEDDFGE